MKFNLYPGTREQNPNTYLLDHIPCPQPGGSTLGPHPASLPSPTAFSCAPESTPSDKRCLQISRPLLESPPLGSLPWPALPLSSFDWEYPSPLPSPPYTGDR